jgi:hypothetical protein
VSSDRELLVDLLSRAYQVLLVYGVENSSNPLRVQMMDEIKQELEFAGTADQPEAAPCQHDWQPHKVLYGCIVGVACSKCGVTRDTLTADQQSAKGQD